MFDKEMLRANESDIIDQLPYKIGDIVTNISWLYNSDGVLRYIEGRYFKITKIQMSDDSDMKKSDKKFCNYQKRIILHLKEVDNIFGETYTCTIDAVRAGKLSIDEVKTELTSIGTIEDTVFISLIILAAFIITFILSFYQIFTAFRWVLCFVLILMSSILAFNIGLNYEAAYSLKASLASAEAYHKRHENT